MSLQSLMEGVVAAAAADGPGLIAARAEWDARSGKVFDDDPLYEERTTAFLEWFALERVDGAGLTYIERHLQTVTEGRDALTLLSRTHRSLFRVRQVDEQQFVLDDLLTGCRFSVHERRTPLALNEGDIFEARLCPRPDASGEVLLTRAIQHHPREAADVIAELAEESRKNCERRDEALFRLAKLRWKSARWGHVQPERIYRGDAEVE
ncbi:MAG: hypothetical protein ABI321_08640 [Polyangia bacterium]